MTAKILECTNADYMAVARAITEFNLKHLPPHSSDNMGSLAYVVKDGSVIIGGIMGKLLLGNCLSIDVLWVGEKYRKQRYGSQLLHTIEDAARLLGSHLSQVDTFDFQALGFYQKNGYELFGTLDDNPCIGNKRYYLKRRL